MQSYFHAAVKIVGLYDWHTAAIFHLNGFIAYNSLQQTRNEKIVFDYILLDLRSKYAVIIGMVELVRL